MKIWLSLLLLFISSISYASELTQSSIGDNSPNVHAGGNVSIIYNKDDTSDVPRPKSNSRVVKIKIKVAATKDNGEYWDRGLTKRQKAPDLAICITYSSNQQECFPLQDREMLKGWGVGTIVELPCKNSYSCVLNEITVKETKFHIEVLDIDQNKAEIIASGVCEIGKLSTFKLATIKVEES